MAGDHDEDVVAMAKSFRVPAGLKVRLFDLGAWNALSRTDTFMRDTPNAGTRVKSIRITPLLPKENHGAYVFEQPGFQGHSQFYPTADGYDNVAPGMSVRTTPGSSAKLFQPGVDTVFVAEGGESPNANNPPGMRLEVTAHCQTPDYCGDHGSCVEPPIGCHCESSWSGQQCNVQIADESSAVFCDANHVMVHEALSCRLIPRRDDVDTRASSLFIRVSLAEDDTSDAVLHGSPLTKIEWAGPPDFDGTEFPFTYVAARVNALRPRFNVKLLGRSEESFVPHIQVTPRCDNGTFVRVACVRTELPLGEMTFCRLKVQASSDAGGEGLECPRRLFLVDGVPLSDLMPMEPAVALGHSFNYTAEGPLGPRSVVVTLAPMPCERREMVRRRERIVNCTDSLLPHTVSAVSITIAPAVESEPPTVDKAQLALLRKRALLHADPKIASAYVAMAPASLDARLVRMKVCVVAQDAGTVQRDAAWVRQEHPEAEPRALLRLAQAQFHILGQGNVSERNLRRCLRLAPEDRGCAQERRLQASRLRRAKELELLEGEERWEDIIDLARQYLT